MEIYFQGGRGGDRIRICRGAKRDRLLRLRQRRRIQPALRRPPLPSLPAPSFAKRVRRHWRRACHRLPHHYPSRRQDLGARQHRPGSIVLLYAALHRLVTPALCFALCLFKSKKGPSLGEGPLACACISRRQEGCASVLSLKFVVRRTKDKSRFFDSPPPN